jgi:hypothetical protein
MASGLAAAAGAWWWFFWSTRPYYHRNLKRERFSGLLRTLLETTKVGAILVIGHEGSDRL